MVKQSLTPTGLHANAWLALKGEKKYDQLSVSRFSSLFKRDSIFSKSHILL